MTVEIRIKIIKGKQILVTVPIAAIFNFMSSAISIACDIRYYRAEHSDVYFRKIVDKLKFRGFRGLYTHTVVFVVYFNINCSLQYLAIYSFLET